MLVWYLLYIRHGFVPITLKKLEQMNVEFIVPTNGKDLIRARLLPEQFALVKFIAGVMWINECTREGPPEVTASRAYGTKY